MGHHNRIKYLEGLKSAADFCIGLEERELSWDDWRGEIREEVKKHEGLWEYASRENLREMVYFHRGKVDGLRRILETEIPNLG